MGYPTKVQLIHRKKSTDQYYINFPTAVAEALEFEKGEVIEWIVEDKANIIAHRREILSIVVDEQRGRAYPSGSFSCCFCPYPIDKTNPLDDER
jgi:hypothetical protein